MYYKTNAIQDNAIYSETTRPVDIVNKCGYLVMLTILCCDQRVRSFAASIRPAAVLLAHTHTHKDIYYKTSASGGVITL